jgi:hypothetical protein
MNNQQSLQAEIDELTRPIPHDSSLLSNTAKELNAAIHDYEFPLCTNSNKKEMLNQLEESYAEVIQDTAFDKKDILKLFQSYKYARQFIDLLKPRHMVPEIYIEPDVEIAFDWIASKDRYLSISISATGYLTYAVLFRGSRSRGRDKLTDEIPDQILFQIERFTKAAL